MNKKIVYPPFKLERKTGALNGALWGFVSLISMITIEFLVIVHSFLCDTLNIESTIISDNFVLLNSILFIVFTVVFGVGLFKLIFTFLISYKLEDNKLIRGITNLKNIDHFTEFDLNATNYILNNADNSKKVMAANAAINYNKLLYLIELNINQRFVEENFDTNYYKKKIYNNPILEKKQNTF